MGGGGGSLWLGIIGFEAGSIFVKNNRRVVVSGIFPTLFVTIFWNDYTKSIRLIVRYAWQGCIDVYDTC